MHAPASTHFFNCATVTGALDITNAPMLTGLLAPSTDELKLPAGILIPAISFVPTVSAISANAISQPSVAIITAADAPSSGVTLYSVIYFPSNPFSSPFASIRMDGATNR